MKTLRTTMDGVEFYLAPDPTPNPNPKPKRPRLRSRLNSEKFYQMRLAIEDSRLLNPEDLQ